LKSEWQLRRSELLTIKTEYIDVINGWAQEKGIPHVIAP